MPDCDRPYVLYIDDDLQLAELVAEYLERIDDTLTVVAESSPAAGHARLKAEPIDCLVTDHRMPGTDGLEFCRDVHEKYPTLPLILVSGHLTETVAAEAQDAGVAATLQRGGGTDAYERLAAQIHAAVSLARSRSPSPGGVTRGK